MTRSAQRFNTGKPELGYILDYPRALEALVRVMEYGANKYDRDNWKLGNKPNSEYEDAALRHMFKHHNEDEFDSESGCLHLAHAVWNLMTLIELNTEGDVYSANSSNPGQSRPAGAIEKEV